MGKGEIAHNEQFLFFPQCFLPVWRTSFHFHEIWNCRLQTLSVWKSLKFVVWQRVDRGIQCGMFACKKDMKPYNDQSKIGPGILFSHSLLKLSLLDGKKKQMIASNISKFDLTLYHVIPNFNNLGEEAFWKHWKFRKEAFAPFFHLDFYPSEKVSVLYSHLFCHLRIWTSLNFCCPIMSCQHFLLVSTCFFKNHLPWGR